MSKIVVFTLLSIGLVLLQGSARADESCTVTGVGYWTPVSGHKQLYISCSNLTGRNYAVDLVTTDAACGTDIDTLKQWETLAVSARLAGKSLFIYGSATTQRTCSGVSINVITGLQL